MKNSQSLKRTAILNFVEANGPVTRQCLIKFIKVDLNGHKDYNPTRDRGYYCDAFWDGSYFYKIGRPNYKPLLTSPRDYDPRYIKKNENGLWEITR